MSSLRAPLLRPLLSVSLFGIALSGMIQSSGLAPENAFAAKTGDSGQLATVESDPSRSIPPGTWRYTRIGWQDLSDWTPRPTAPETGLERLSPWSFGLAIGLLAFAALLWASDEWNVERFLNGPEAVCRRRHPRSPDSDRIPSSLDRESHC